MATWWGLGWSAGTSRISSRRSDWSLNTSRQIKAPPAASPTSAPAAMARSGGSSRSGSVLRTICSVPTIMIMSVTALAAWSGLCDHWALTRRKPVASISTSVAGEGSYHVTRRRAHQCQASGAMEHNGSSTTDIAVFVFAECRNETRHRHNVADFAQSNHRSAPNIAIVVSRHRFHQTDDCCYIANSS